MKGQSPGLEWLFICADNAVLEFHADGAEALERIREAQLEDITAHYATTLRLWRERFLASADTLPALGYDERFHRLWELYLSYCEGGFRERRIQDVQLLLAKPGFH